MKSPGPLAPPWTRPRRKMTPRSYSLTIFMALNMTEPTKIAIITNTMNAKPISTTCNKLRVAYTRYPPFRLALQVQRPVVFRPLDRHHLYHPSSVAETHHNHFAPRAYYCFGISWVGLLRSECQHGPPPLAVHENPSLRR